MSIYKYIALSGSGEKMEGSILGENYEDAYNSLRTRQCHPIELKEASISSQDVSVEDLLMFFMHLDLQLKCKIKINDAIESFLNLHGDKELKSTMASVLTDLKNGVSIGEAFEKCNGIFDAVVIGILKSAEKTGKVSDVISSILQFIELQSDWKNNVKRAIAYPIFIACVAVLVLILSITFLGPQVVSLMEITESESMPILTQFIVNILPQLSKTIIYVMPIFFLLLMTMISSKTLRFAFMNVVLKSPKIGALIVKINLWQFCKILHMALEAKLDFLHALNLAIEANKIDNIKQELIKAQKQIIEGYSISASFSQIKFISKAMISAIDIGEEGSNLSASFNHISKNQYTEILLDIKSVGQGLSVGITLFTGLIFILILSGLFFPIYSYVETAGTL